MEYAEGGQGLPILNCHGVLGCHADGVDGWWTNMLEGGFGVISPSRFGYFGSTLGPNATPADQADAYALLLDHLGIDRAAIIGYSAGSASVLEFALRHPNRTVGLLLANARLGGPTPNKLLKPILGCRLRPPVAVLGLLEAAAVDACADGGRPQRLPGRPLSPRCAHRPHLTRFGWLLFAGAGTRPPRRTRAFGPLPSVACRDAGLGRSRVLIDPCCSPLPDVDRFASTTGE